MSRRYSTLLKHSDGPIGSDDPSSPSSSSSASSSLMTARKSPRSPAAKAATKLFVLDSNVLMHDPTSLFRFEEHDIYLPIITLEELDAHKKGMSEVARSARQVSRFLDELVSRTEGEIADGVALERHERAAGGGAKSGRLFLQTEMIQGTLPPSMPMGK